jgi:hypothetical protein
VFTDGTTFSFYGAEIANFQITRDQVEDEHHKHRLFYEQCALGTQDPKDDVRIVRALRGAEYDKDAVRNLCYGRLEDEFIGLKESFGDREMTKDEDWAYWWIRHHGIVQGRDYGGFGGFLYWLINWPIMELAFGWGVRLQNLALTAASSASSSRSSTACSAPTPFVQYNGHDVPDPRHPVARRALHLAPELRRLQHRLGLRHDAQSRFRYINTIQTFLGLILVTFFVGAYTRMILA